MRLSSLVRTVILALAVIGFTSVAHATPITYQMTGTASGTIGGTSFSNALVTLTGTGNTANIVSIFGSVLAAPIATMTVAIQGVGTATITDATEIFSSVVAIPLDTGFPILPYVVIGRIDSPPALGSFTGIGVAGDTALLGYNLATSFAPLSTSPGGIGFPTSCGTAIDFPCLGTTLGTLSFTSNFSATGQGTFSATLQPVPEPASLLLLGSGVVGFVGRSRFRRRA